MLTAYSEMTEARERQQAKYRFYCDNDAQHLDGSSRWTLRSDPPPASRPSEYIEQAIRPKWRHREEQYQQWEDICNGVIMGASVGCEDPNTRAQTYRLDNWVPGDEIQSLTVLPLMPTERAVVTVRTLQYFSVHGPWMLTMYFLLDM